MTSQGPYSTILKALTIAFTLSLTVTACTPHDAPPPPSGQEPGQQSSQGPGQQPGQQSSQQSGTPLPPSGEVPAPIPQPDSALAWQAPLEINPDDGLYVAKNFSTPDRWQELYTTLSENPFKGIPVSNDAQLYLDAELTLPLPTTNAIQGERYEVVPGTNWSATKASRIYTHQGPDKRLAEQTLFTDGNWSAFATYYLLQRTDRDGKILQRPEVTPIIVKGHVALPPPRLSYIDGRVLLSTGDLGPGIEDIRIVKATREWDIDNQESHLAYIGLPPEHLVKKGAFYDITGNVEATQHTTNFVLSRARNSLEMFENLTAKQQKEYLDHSGAQVFVLALVNGRWQASAPTPLTPLAAKVPISIVGDPLAQGADALAQWDYPSIDALPNTVGAIAADGQARHFATNFSVMSIDEEPAPDGSHTATLRLSPRDSSIWRAVTLTFDGNREALEAALKAHNERPIATEGTPLHFHRPVSPSAWVEEAPGTIEIPHYVFGTTPMARFIAANLIAGYNRMSLSSFPESASYSKVENALLEGVSQNPEILNIGDGFPPFTYDASTQLLTVDMRMVQAGSRSEYLTLQSQVVARARSIVQGIITPGMSDDQKARAINQWLVDNVEYDDGWLKKRRAETLEQYGHDTFISDDRGVDKPQQAIGSLLYGKAICSGYGQGFLLLARHAGLESIVVEGSVGPEPHLWNKVKIDGIWLHYDSTWNDNDWKPNTYINLTDGQIENDGARYIVWNGTLQESNADQFKNGDSPHREPAPNQSGARG